MNKILSAGQWRHLDEARKPEPASFPLSSRDGGDVVKVVNGAVLRKAA